MNRKGIMGEGMWILSEVGRRPIVKWNVYSSRMYIVQERYKGSRRLREL